MKKTKCSLEKSGTEIRPGRSSILELIVLCHRVDSDDYYEEEEAKVAVVVAGEASLEVQVAPLAEFPDSPSPSLSSGSPVAPPPPSPPLQAPVGDANTFMGFYKRG